MKTTDNSKQTFLITGASGLLGATVLSELRLPYRVFGTYLRHPIEHSGYALKKLDLTDRSATNSFLSEIKPDIILHTAAAVNVDECETDRQTAYRTNVDATEILAEYVEKNNKKMIYISTDAFFDGEGKLFAEDDEPTPMNYYGETKLLGEKIVHKYCKDHLIVRTNLYGWNYQDKLSLAEWILLNIGSHKKTNLVHDVHCTPILTNTLVDCLDLLIKKNIQGTFHIGGGRSISKLELGELLCKEFGLDLSYIVRSSVKDLNLKAPRSANMSLNISKIKKALPEIKFGIESDIARFKALYDAGYVEKLKGKPFKFNER